MDGSFNEGVKRKRNGRGGETGKEENDSGRGEAVKCGEKNKMNKRKCQ